jgi:hypothetical protein
MKKGCPFLDRLGMKEEEAMRVGERVPSRSILKFLLSNLKYINSTHTALGHLSFIMVDQALMQDKYLGT